MGRSEITAGLSELLERRLAKQSILWAKEVSIEPLGRCRPDYVSVRASWGKFASVSDMESAVVSVYEVKSCIDDYRSGSGLNPVGDANYVVCPYELMMKVAELVCDGKMADGGYGAWGNLYPYPESHGKAPNISELPRYEGQVDGWRLYHVGSAAGEARRRQAPLIAILWSMMYAGVHQGWRC